MQLAVARDRKMSLPRERFDSSLLLEPGGHQRCLQWVESNLGKGFVEQTAHARATVEATCRAARVTQGSDFQWCHLPKESGRDAGKSTPPGGEVQKEHWQDSLAWKLEKAQARIELEANMRRSVGQACPLGKMIAYEDGEETDA